MRLLARSSTFWLSTVMYFLLSVSLNSQVNLPLDVSTSSTFYCGFEPQQVDPSKVSAPPAPNNMILGRSECDVYNRAEQMFFWLTSPPTAYGGGSYVFTSSIFHTVSPRQNGRRLLLQQSGANSAAGLFDIALSQAGPNGISVVFDKMGSPHDLRQPKWLLNDTGSKIEIQRITSRPLTPFSPLFFDMDGNIIRYGKDAKMFDDAENLITPSLRRPVIFANGVRYPQDVDGNAIDYRVDQAKTNKVLMTQKGKLVYYGILVNDVYANYYRSRPNNPPTEFPTEIDDVSRHLPDAETLAVALKTAWIEVKDNELKDYKQKYLTIAAEVPIYDRKSNYCWEFAKRTRPATLALVGMHVTFAAQNQPKMIWATFEHLDNTRNKSYQYDTDKATKSHEDNKGEWLFSKSWEENNGNYNVPRMHVNKNGNIVGDGSRDECDKDVKYQKTIGPSNIRRDFAWGSENSRANTNLIRVNEGFIKQLPPGDVRRNYIMIGATWSGNTTGGTKLANSTMETFVGDSQCLGCHYGTKLSHIWSDLSK